MLNLIIVISFICTGVFTATRRSMILYQFRAMYLIEMYRMRNTRPKFGKVLKYLSYVLFDCLYCMASFWTIVCVAVFDYRMLIYFPFLIFAVCGLNGVFAYLVFGSRLNPDK